VEIRRNIARQVNRILQERHQTLTELSADLDIPRSSLENYAKGTANLRVDSLQMLAERLGMTPAELVSGLPDPSGWTRARSVLSAVQEISSLSPERQETGICAFLQLVSVFTTEKEIIYDE
jgi:transcriptional regulator with XRE-family HTH domain